MSALLQGIDPSLFPVLKTRRALIVVDAQNDFLSEDGPLHANVPSDLTGRIARLVSGFRPFGDIVWIRSEYDQPRHAKSEQIITSDAPAGPPRRSSSSKGRKAPQSVSDQPPSRCPEAFLSGPVPGRPVCARKDTDGAQLPAAIQEVVEKKDMSFVKTHYSAFQIPNLIQRLRMKFVSEVFICGSFTNIGVMATAIDAGSHGLDIGIIEDCCGYRDSKRHSGALSRIQEMTGCEILSADQILNRLKPKPKVQRMAAPIPNPTGRRYPSIYEASPSSANDKAATKEGASSASPANLESSLAKMSLAEDTQSDLPPIIFTRARVAARGRPSRPLPDIEKQLGERFGIKGGMNANPNDDLNAESEDESQNGGPTNAPSAAQPQNGVKARIDENTPEKVPSVVDSKGPSKRSVDGVAVKSSTLNNGKRSYPTEILGSASKDLGSQRKAIQSIKEVVGAVPTKIVPAALEDLPEERIDKEDSAAMDGRDTNSAESEPLCEGDTKVLYNVLPSPLSDDIFEKIRGEVDWKRMSHQGGEVPRLVAVQGEVDVDGNIPVYRHPADESPPLLPWTATVEKIKDVVEQKVGHPLNHALIQFYRDGNDYISEHSDKTLDIVKDSFIVNVSLGAERTMVLRTKRQPKQQDGTQPASTADGLKREAQRARLPHNSMCRMGLQTNMRWLHAIRQDKRLDRDKTEEELAYGGARISLTFRQIGTFLDRDQKVIWGQGATGKTQAEARDVINGQSPEAVKMLQAFGRENQTTEFDWSQHYGQGFDVLHISAAPRLFTSSDPIANMRVQLMLGELGVGHAKGSSAPVSTDRSTLREHRASGDPPVKLVDNDAAKSTISGDLAIMMYLNQYHSQQNEAPADKADVARALTRFQEALVLGERRLAMDDSSLKRHLDPWEVYAGEHDFIAGPSIGMVDFAFWPVLYDIVDGSWGFASHPKLKTYYERIRGRDTIVKVLGKEKVVHHEPKMEDLRVRSKETAAKAPSKEKVVHHEPKVEDLRVRNKEAVAKAPGKEKVVHHEPKIEDMLLSYKKSRPAPRGTFMAPDALLELEAFGLDSVEDDLGETAVPDQGKPLAKRGLDSEE